MISVYLNGRLGNNLFQYIFCRIASIKQNCNFYIPKNFDESINFYTFCNQKLYSRFEMSCESNPHYWKGESIFDLDFGINDWSINHLVSETNINNVKNGALLTSFYQSDYYMKEFEEIIINEWLKFKPELSLNCQPIIEKFPINEYCYIHFRGGDYKGIKEYFLPNKYYEDGINKVKNLFPNLKFVVITDDKEEAHKYFPDFEILSNPFEVDFYLLSQSKYSIIPNSTFSWWASWLNKNSSLIIAPNRWLNYNGYYGEGFEPKQIKTDKFFYI